MKTASLAWFYMGEDSYINRVAQETVPVWRALEGYDHQVLLRHETDIGKLELSEAAEKRADVILTPTREHLAEQLNDLAKKDFLTDIYIFSHGWHDAFLSSEGSYGENNKVTQRFLEAAVPESLNIRAVWMGICHGETMNDCWKNLGAQVSAGTRSINFFPTRWKRFAKAWAKGATFEQAIKHSDSWWTRQPVYAYIQADATVTRHKWGGMPFGRSVLGSHPQSGEYFRHRWLSENDYTEGKSGRWNMRHASEYVIDGDGSVKRAA